MNEAVGVFCLASMWLMALLVAASAAGDLRDLVRLRARFRRLGAADLETVGLAECEIVSGDGAEGAFATCSLTELGRALDDAPRGEPRISYRETGRVSVLHGGVVRADGVTMTVAATASRVAVWARAAVPETTEEDGAFAAACSPKGHVRQTSTTLRSGDRAFIIGELARVGDELVLGTPKTGDTIVAVEDPRRTTSWALVLGMTFIVGELAVCAACTRLALWRPLFGRISTAGAVSCIAFFLGVTPIGVWVRTRMVR